MGYRSSPRPQYDGPAHIPYESITRYLWGDKEANRVADWIYISNENIHQIVYGMAQGGCYTHSNDFRTIFGADEVMIVVKGQFALANPETGEVVRLDKGDAVFFRKDTWHHGFNIGEGEVRVLEYFSPPPLQGTSGAYARKKPMLPREAWRYVPAEYESEWPIAAKGGLERQTLHKLTDENLLWTMQGHRSPTLVGLYADTQYLRAGRVDLLPGQQTDVESHGGDESIYVESGTLFIHLLEQDGPDWFELAPRDGFYIPAGTKHEYHNLADEPARFYFGVAPNQ